MTYFQDIMNFINSNKSQYINIIDLKKKYTQQKPNYIRGIVLVGVRQWTVVFVPQQKKTWNKIHDMPYVCTIIVCIYSATMGQRICVSCIILWQRETIKGNLYTPIKSVT